uniref:Uncharacterized protein n=1 Tax=Anguilla anguilla TaxID=7936 RepID=A0A0E9ULB4_ANGAN
MSQSAPLIAFQTVQGISDVNMCASVLRQWGRRGDL